MHLEGPELEVLTRRLAETPPEFLLEPRIGDQGVVHTAAVVADLIRDLGGPAFAREDAAPFVEVTAADGPWLRAVLIGAWLLHDPWFRARQGLAARAYTYLREGMRELAATVPAEKLVADPDRREELVRLTLKALGFRPAGESPAQAQDRLTTVSTVERRRVIQEARAAEERARQVREAMARKAAEEAAAKYSRE